MALGHLRDRPISSGAGQWLPMVRTIHKKSSLSSSQMCSKQTPGPPPPFGKWAGNRTFARLFTGAAATISAPPAE